MYYIPCKNDLVGSKKYESKSLNYLSNVQQILYMNIIRSDLFFNKMLSFIFKHAN